MRFRFGALAFALIYGVAALAGDAELLTEDAEATFDLTGQTRLEIAGVKGVVVVRLGRRGELRYMTTNRDDRLVKRPIALWQEGSALRLVPPAGAEERPRLLEVTISQDVVVALNLSDCVVMVTGLLANLEMEGERLELQARGLGGLNEFALKDSSIDIQGGGKQVRLHGSALRGKLAKVEGPVDLRVAGSKFVVSEITGNLNADSDGTELSVDHVAGFVYVQGSGGTLALTHAGAGGELRLSSTALVLSNSKGPFLVEGSGAPLQCFHVTGPMRLRGTNATITGAACGEGLELHSDGGEINLQDVRGATTIHGDAVAVKLASSLEQLTIKTTGSSITVNGAKGPVTIENDFGDVEVNDAAQQVQLTNREGDVRVTHQQGPLQLRASGSLVEVSWTAVPQQDSSVENEHGDVRLLFPAAAACRLQAQSQHGEIETELPDIKVSKDGLTAAGTLNRGMRPLIQVKSGRDIYLGPLSPDEMDSSAQ